MPQPSPEGDRAEQALVHGHHISTYIHLRAKAPHRHRRAQWQFPSRTEPELCLTESSSRKWPSPAPRMTEQNRPLFMVMVTSISRYPSASSTVNMLAIIALCVTAKGRLCGRAQSDYSKAQEGSESDRQGVRAASL